MLIHSRRFQQVWANVWQMLKHWLFIVNRKVNVSFLHPVFNLDVADVVIDILLAGTCFLYSSCSVDALLNSKLIVCSLLAKDRTLKLHCISCLWAQNAWCLPKLIIYAFIKVLCLAALITLYFLRSRKPIPFALQELRKIKLHILLSFFSWKERFLSASLLRQNEEGFDLQIIMHLLWTLVNCLASDVEQSDLEGFIVVFLQNQLLDLHTPEYNHKDPDENGASSS